MSDWIWVLIPLAAILVPVARQWLRIKEQTALLGTSAKDLRSDLQETSRQVEVLVRERENLVRRLQHLEAIVTSEAWDLVATDPALAAAKVEGGLLDDIRMDDESLNERQAAAIAHRLRG